MMEKMSTVNLLIVGLLLDKPMSAYEMAQIVEKQVIGRLIKISAPAVYKNIKKLHNEGYLIMEAVKEGEMPEKKIYTVTEEGKAYFLRLMEYYSSHLTDHYYEFNAFLINLNYVDKDTGLRMLANLKAQFGIMHGWIVEHEKEAVAHNVFFVGRAIIKQYRMVITTLLAWIDEVVEEYRQTDDLGKSSFAPHHGEDMPLHSE